MLVLTRRPGQVLDFSNGIQIKLVRVKGDAVQLGIVAPPDIRVMRREATPTIRGKTDSQDPPKGLGGPGGGV
jgi:carbon storage regulator CsrA